MGLSAWIRVAPLFGFSFVEIAVAFVRAIILTRFLDAYEFGFASAISLVFSTALLVTDLAIYRFILSTPREEFVEALSGAHALVILRGLLVATGLLLVSVPASCTFATCGDWQSFALLAPVVLIASFEHLEIRIAERDYRYWRQFIASLVSHSLGLAALGITAWQTANHYAFLSYLYVQAITYVLLSHALATLPYRITFRSPYVARALAFGLPLLVSGVTAAVIAQGDRFIVGAMLGLEILGFYAVLSLAGLIPISGLIRVLNSLFFAGFHNAHEKDHFQDRIKLFFGVTPLLAGLYALGIVGLLQLALPLVFGPRFTATDPLIFLIAAIAVTRISRLEPSTSLLLQKQRTTRLAAANVSLFSGLLVASILVALHRNIEGALVGTLIGELTALCFTMLAVRSLAKDSTKVFLRSFLASLVVLLIAFWVISSSWYPQTNVHRIAATAFLAFLLAAYGLFALRVTYQSAYDAKPVKPDTGLPDRSERS
jgi:O-antigen/teichoic acid export membrane protein